VAEVAECGKTPTRRRRLKITIEHPGCLAWHRRRA